MESWLKDFNSRMLKENRNVILFLDNATSHPHLELSNVKIVFSPPNTTSNLQPMDQGIIQNFKVKYRKLLLTKLVGAISNCNNVTEIKKSITILDALYWIESAVASISCVLNCFRKAGFPINIITENNYNPS